MHRGSRRFALLIALALAALGAIAAAALGASTLVVTKIKGGPGEGGGAYMVSGSKLLPNNGMITAPSTFKCNSANLIVKATSIKLTGGKINYKGPAYVNKFRAPKVLGTLTWKGTPTKGTIRFQAKQKVVIKPPKVSIVTKACDTGVQQYVPG